MSRSSVLALERLRADHPGFALTGSCGVRSSSTRRRRHAPPPSATLAQASARPPAAPSPRPARPPLRAPTRRRHRRRRARRRRTRRRRRASPTRRRTLTGPAPSCAPACGCCRACGTRSVGRGTPALGAARGEAAQVGRAETEEGVERGRAGGSRRRASRRVSRDLHRLEAQKLSCCAQSPRPRSRRDGGVAELAPPRSSQRPLPATSACSAASSRPAPRSSCASAARPRTTTSSRRPPHLEGGRPSPPWAQQQRKAHTARSASSAGSRPPRLGSGSSTRCALSLPLLLLPSPRSSRSTALALPC